MTKSELVNVVAETTGLSQAKANETINATLATIQNALAEGDRVILTGFGTFESRHRKARTGVKPGTTEQIEIPASNYPAFKPGKTLKDAVNK